MMNRKVLIGTVAACIIGIVVALIVSSSGQGAPGDRVVTFQDRNLDAAIREALNKPSGPIHASELARLTSLTAFNSGIEDLSGLQYCTNLTDLDLYSNQISDISPLGNLTKLEYLSLESNQISDVLPLANLTALTDLDLSRNHIGDMSPLGDLSNLQYLYLRENQISGISPLANLTDLIEILLYSNQISDISPLVDNLGLGEGDSVSLGDNPLSSDSINTYIPQLRARGVTVDY